MKSKLGFRGFASSGSSSGSSSWRPYVGLRLNLPLQKRISPAVRKPKRTRPTATQTHSVFLERDHLCCACDYRQAVYQVIAVQESVVNLPASYASARSEATLSSSCRRKSTLVPWMEGQLATSGIPSRCTPSWGKVLENPELKPHLYTSSVRIVGQTQVVGRTQVAFFSADNWVVKFHKVLFCS